jgi:N-acetyl-anhydromuramyl-L-alanine amidase AmpD
MDKKLADYLWTARWGVDNGKPESARASITEALIHIGAERGEPEVEPDRPSAPIPPDFEAGITEPEFVVVRGTRFANKRNYRTSGGRFSGLVVHYTVSGRTAQNAINVLKYLARINLGCMVMDEDGKIYIPENFDILREWSSHAGVSKWGNLTSVSQYFAGMEICCWGRNSSVGPFRETKAQANMIAGKYQTYTEAQEKALTNFILWALKRNPEFKIDNVVGHDELRTAAGRHGDKQDPGASLSMTMPAYRDQLKRLAKA